MDRTKTLAGVIALGMASLCGAGCGQGPAVTVGSKNLTEQVLLGEILAQHLERRLHIKVARKLDLGGTLVAHQALVSGEIDLYPEYTGTALTAVLKQPSVTSPAAAFEEVRAEYAKRWKVDWLAPLGFNNSFAMIVKGAEARAGKLQTLSDAAAARSWRMGVGYEFVQRPDGLDGLLATYKMHLAAAPVTMDLGLLYSALDSGQVDMIAASATDGQIARRDVVVLEDNYRYFPPYQCAVAVRQAAEERIPGLRAALEELSGKISDAAMRKLNYAVDVEHRPEAKVAAEFLNGK
jgi:glycine betaine/choline ABC-type transport system substrate-binding protein